MLLEGKTAIITGAAWERDNCRATAKLFAVDGARIAILDLDRAASESVAAETRLAHRGYACDVADNAACERVAGRVIAELGGVDAPINVAGISQSYRFMEVTPEHFDEVMDASLRGCRRR